ncbi:hypothetical protein KXD93_26835 [Mucilaginibacter sp. BJC16-A38]|uniref:hypothetical protein n=1 Tax=Mucilaginibacter phenanthrenivorans TaxID=1234842 RepID=UPI002157D016|nr:hypothetical protein [Mucilaginibacter phenanthrenivorans]MCR8561298.1 hypothetical protein [Mucilaginibacter phenanthrenivorans]
MSKFIKYCKSNLLGIAVAIGVCAFIYEGLIHPTLDFTLTKIAGALIFGIAVSSKFRDNRARNNQARKVQSKKQDLNNTGTQQQPL